MLTRSSLAFSTYAFVYTVPKVEILPCAVSLLPMAVRPWLLDSLGALLHVPKLSRHAVMPRVHPDVSYLVVAELLKAPHFAALLNLHDRDGQVSSSSNRLTARARYLWLGILLRVLDPAWARALHMGHGRPLVTTQRTFCHRTRSTAALLE
jgi:hypothetical protein